MNLERDFAAEGRAIIDANLYMVLGTADRAGRPWATPVYYAHADYREFLWVSKPEARHSRNLEAREAVYSRRGVSHGGRVFSAGDVEPPARLRLYAATALDAFVLDENDERVPVAL